MLLVVFFLIFQLVHFAWTTVVDHMFSKETESRVFSVQILFLFCSMFLYILVSVCFRNFDRNMNFIQFWAKFSCFYPVYTRICLTDLLLSQLIY